MPAANIGVSRFRSGTDRKAAMIRPAKKIVVELRYLSRLASAGLMKRMAANSKYSRPSR